MSFSNDSLHNQDQRFQFHLDSDYPHLLLIPALGIGRFVKVFVHHAHEVIDLFARGAHGHVLGILRRNENVTAKGR